MAELYMARTCKWGILRVVGGDVWNHSGDVLITPANNRLSGREGLDALIHGKAGPELTQCDTEYLPRYAENQRSTLCSHQECRH